MSSVIKNIVRFVGKNLEALLWLSGLTYLALINPYASGHLNMCAFSLVGIDNCPGCGLGRSVSMLFHGDIGGSFHMHPLGLFALIMIVYRIINLLYRNRKFNRPMEVYNG